MAVTQITSNDVLALKQWSKTLSVETLKALRVSELIGKGDGNIIQEYDEAGKSGGDCVTFALRAQMLGTGVSEGQTLTGNEEALQFMHDKVYLNELYHATRVKNEGSIDQQRMVINLRNQCRSALADWFADRLSLMFFIQVCGYTARKLIFEGREIDLSSVHWGFNEPTEPTSKRIVRPENKAKDEELTDAAKHVFSLNLIDKAVRIAKLANPRIRPIRIGNERVYVLYLHPLQVEQLRTNTEKGQWLDIQKAVYSGSRQSNPIYNGSLGMYNGVVLKEHEHVTCGVHSTNKSMQPNVRRAVLLGAQSAVIAFGKGITGTRYRLKEELFDYEREYGLAASTLMGVKKTRFKLPSGGEGLQDYGTVVISSYSKEE